MGLRDLFFNKLNKKIAEDIGQDQPDRVENDEVEKASYSEYSYKKVAKLREKGRLYGFRVPYLQHPVNKREKARPLFVVLGVIGIILLALATALVVMITLNFTLPLFSTALGLTDWLVPREWDVFGVVALMGSLVPILTWALIVLVVLVCVGIEVYFIYFTRKMFALSKISMQEMAVGYEINRLITSLITAIAITITVGVGMIVSFKEMNTTGRLIIILAMVIISLLIGSVLAGVIASKVKAKKQFEQLSPEQKEDFIQHNKMLERITTRSKRNKGVFNNSVDF